MALFTVKDNNEVLQHSSEGEYKENQKTHSMYKIKDQLIIWMVEKCEMVRGSDSVKNGQLKKGKEKKGPKTKQKYSSTEVNARYTGFLIRYKIES